ncbi:MULTISPECIES: transposase family protein [unclassified Streptomyces]|uniref:transposase family protein n=1 Tax=unclassified Streptomyces TaxID=2593676 RepID=UPI00338F685C
MPDELQHPELTGMTRQQLSDLINTMIPGLEESREQARHAARGGPRRVARGTGRRPSLTPADQILVTILYLRKHSLQELLGQLFNTTAMTISRAVKDVPRSWKPTTSTSPPRHPGSPRQPTSQDSSARTTTRSNQRVDSRQVLTATKASPPNPTTGVSGPRW